MNIYIYIYYIYTSYAYVYIYIYVCVCVWDVASGAPFCKTHGVFAVSLTMDKQAHLMHVEHVHLCFPCCIQRGTKCSFLSGFERPMSNTSLHVCSLASACFIDMVTATTVAAMPPAVAKVLSLSTPPSSGVCSYLQTSQRLQEACLH